MECPECEGPLVCNGNKKVKWGSFFGKCPSSVNRKSKITRTWLCKRCNKIFAVRMLLTEVELA